MARKTKTPNTSEMNPSGSSGALMEECPYPIFRLDPKGKLLLANRATLKAPGILSDDGKRVSDELSKLVVSAFKNNSSERADIQSGSRIYNLLFNPEIESGYVNVFGRDVTSIRAQSKTMADFAKFPEENPNPVLRITPEGEVLVANPSARKLEGLIVPGPPERVNPELACFASEVASNGKNGDFEFALSDGRVLLFSFALIEGKGYLNTYGRDMTAELQAKKDLEAANDRLEARVAERTASVRLLQNVVLAANTADSFETALQSALHEICLFADWSVGHAYVVRHENGKDVLVPSGIWQIEDSKQASALRNATETLRFGTDEGLPGRVLRTGQPAWIEDLSHDTSLRRIEFARAAELNAAMAFPIVLHDQVVGVLEFFAKEPQVSDVETVKTLGHVGTLLGSVAQRKQAEDAVSLSKQEAETAHDRLMIALEAMDQAICLFDKDDRIVLFNKGYSDLFTVFTGGVPPKIGNSFEVGLRLSSKVMHARMTSEEQEAWVQNVLKVRRENAVRDSTDLMPDGKWMRSQGYATADGGSVSVFTDITEAKQHEAELGRLAEEAELAHSRLMDAVEAMGQAICLFDKEERIVLWNSEYEKVSRTLAPGLKIEQGMPFREILKQTAPNVHPEFSKKELDKWMNQVLEERLSTDIRSSMNQLPDGSWLRSEGYRTSDGGTVSVFTDMTDAKETEAELARLADEAKIAHQRLTAAIEAIGQGFVLYDKDDRVVLFNQRVSELFSSSFGGKEVFKVGLKFEDIIRQSENATRNLTNDKDREEWVQKVMKARREQKVRSSVDQQSDGRWLRSEGFQTDEGGIVSVFTDITETIQHEAELDELVKELGVARDAAVQANSAKSQFLANMSHELRTPLNAIIGYSELLIDDTVDDGNDDYVPDLTKIQKAGQHLLGLINDILDLSKIEVGKIELYAEEFDLDELLEDIRNTIKPVVEKNSNTLQIRNDCGQKTAHNDLTKLRQCLFNLLSNAAKFTENGEIHLTTSLAEDGTLLEFKVRDQGIGMTPDQMEKIFDPFTQADASTSRNFGGTGLGLSITREFSRMMGGELTVQSEPGAGSTFTMTVLKEAGEIGSAPGAREVEDLPEDAPVVLMIDDDPLVRDLLFRHFTNAGLRTIEAASGEEGLKLARSEKPDVITLDVMMPGTDGWSVLAALKSDAETFEIPVVMVTIVENKRLGFSMGAADYMTKPIERDKLVKIVRSLVADEENPHLLVVEDDADTRSLLCRTLGESGLTFEEAENGRVALEKLKTFRPSLILLDLMMPEMDGFEFAEAFRSNKEWDDIPIIVLTAKTLTSEDRARLEGWAEAYYAKGDRNVEQIVADVQGRIGDKRAKSGA
ncbi:PAS-domain containing protein [Actibacterium pelagium]|nr:PAS-domain containing protein [Actibacterium pelagium]